MILGFVLVSLALLAYAWVLWELFRAPRVDEDRCPYRVGTDRVDCGGPCEERPPCLEPWGLT